MRAIWKGAIAFGLVNVPVKVYSATEDHDISLHQVHNADGGRIRYQRRCEVCSKVIDYEDIDKAYEDDGRTVILSREELKSIPAENSHEIEVVQFVPAEQLDPMTFEKSYYLEPDAKSPKAYVLLRRALEDTDRVAIVQFALREKTRLGAGAGNVGGPGRLDGGRLRPGAVHGRLPNPTAAADRRQARTGRVAGHGGDLRCPGGGSRNR